MRRAASKDANHTAVVETFRKHGCIVSNWGTDGAPDIVVGIRGVTFLVEIKDGKKSPSARQLTAIQDKWHRTWRGSPVFIVECVEDVPTTIVMALDYVKVGTPDELHQLTLQKHRAAIDSGEVTPVERRRK